MLRRLAVLIAFLAACETQPVRDTPIMTDHGGTVLSQPKVYSVAWQGDEEVAAAADRLHAAVMATPAVWGTLAEYGVQPGTAGGAFTIPAPAPATLDDADVDPLLRGLIADGTLPAPDENTVYALFPPRGTTVTVKGTAGCQCGGFEGYHTSGASGLVYAVDLRCTMDTFDAALSLVSSHELGEAATDPRPNASPAWFSGSDGEVADLCQYQYRPTVTTSIGEEFPVNSYFSNIRSANGVGDPCSPDPYFNVWTPQESDVYVGSDGTAVAHLEFVPYGDPGVDAIDFSVSDRWSCASSATVLFSRTDDLTDASATLAGSAKIGEHVRFTAFVKDIDPNSDYFIKITSTRGADVNVAFEYF